MKIVGKRMYKDYYDYLQGIYGIDSTVVFDRTSKQNFFQPKDVLAISTPIPVVIAICDIIYIVYVYNGVAYPGEEIKSILKEGRKYFYGQYYYFNDKIFSISLLEKTHKKPTNINTKSGKPALILKGFGYTSEENIKTDNFRMSDFGIQKMVSAHDMYVMINNFLSKEKEITDNRTNKEKILTNGFNYKTSFRNM